MNESMKYMVHMNEPVIPSEPRTFLELPNQSRNKIIAVEWAIRTPWAGEEELAMWPVEYTYNTKAMRYAQVQMRFTLHSTLGDMTLINGLNLK